jgi:hypothetical protein
MRMLRKRGTDRVFIYTDFLAMHPDMEPFDVPDQAPAQQQAPPPRTGGLAAAINAATVASTPAPQASHDANDGGDPASQVTSVYDITDKDQLRAMLKDRGIQVAGNPGLKTLQDKLAKALTE